MKKITKADVSNFFSRRQHPLRIFGYTTKYFYLLLIPLAKYLIAVRFDITGWIRDKWVDVLTLLAILIYAAIRWGCITYQAENDFLIAKTGFFGIKRSKIYYSQITSLSLEENLFLRIVKGCKVYIDTQAGGQRKADLDLVLSEKNASEMFEKIAEFSKRHSSPYPKTQYKQKPVYLLIFSVLFSSTLTGAIIFATLFYKASKYLNKSFENMLLEQFNSITEILSKYVPKAIMAIAIFIVGGWLISFITNMLSNWNFTCFRRGKSLTIKGGVIHKRKHFISVSKINYIDLQQSLLMKLFKICSVRIHCPGFGKRRSEVDAIIPISTMNEVKSTLKLLLFNSPKGYTKIAPKKSEITRFLFLPIILNALLPIALIILRFIFPNLSGVIFYILLAFQIPCIWFFIVKSTAVFSTSIGVSGDSVKLCYNYIYTFHTIETDLKRIVKAEIAQTVFQKKKNICTIKIYTRAERRKIHYIRYVNYTDAVNFLSSCGLWDDEFIANE